MAQNRLTRNDIVRAAITFVDVHGLDALAYDHPGIFPLIAAQPAQAPWLRPPLRSLRWVGESLSTLKRFEFSDATAVGAHKSFTSFLIGDLLLEVHSPDLDTVDEDDYERSADDSDLSHYPTVNALSDLLREDHRRRQLDDALDELIERLRLTPTTATSHSSLS